MRVAKEKELTKEEVLQLEEGTWYSVYNPLTDSYKFERASNHDIAHNKYAYDKLVFFEAEKYEETREDWFRSKNMNIREARNEVEKLGNELELYLEKKKISVLWYQKYINISKKIIFTRWNSYV